MRPRSVAAGLVAGAAGILLLRRRGARRVEHVTLTLADGSTLLLEDGPDAQPLLAAAREALAAARG